MSIGWGIVGIGRHADGKMAPAIRQATDSELVAVCSRDKERAVAFAAKHGAKRSYDSFEEFLHDRELDALYIATPNSLHLSQTVQAAEAGKHVLCEKPMALTVADCEQMIRACEKSRVKLGVDFQNRHHPAHVEARRLILSGAVGEITMATAQYSHGLLGGTRAAWRADPDMAGGGSLMGMGVHAIDLLRFLIGRPVAEVTAFTDKDRVARKVDETVLALLRFEGGPFAFALTGRWDRAYNDVVIYGTKARITGVYTVGMPLQGELHVKGDTMEKEMRFPCDDRVSGNYVLVVEDFNRAIQENRDPIATGWDGLEMARLTDAILRSGAEGRAIKISR